MKRRAIKQKKAVTWALCIALSVSLAGCGENGVAETNVQTDGGAEQDGAEQDGAETDAAEGIVFRVNTDISGLDESHQISDTLFGIFLEDINYAVDGGMYAELLKNRSFEYGMEARDGQMHGWEATNEAVAFSCRTEAVTARPSMKTIPNMWWWKIPALLQSVPRRGSAIRDFWRALPFRKGLCMMSPFIVNLMTVRWIRSA